MGSDAASVRALDLQPDPPATAGAKVERGPRDALCREIFRSSSATAACRWHAHRRVPGKPKTEGNESTDTFTGKENSLEKLLSKLHRNLANMAEIINTGWRKFLTLGLRSAAGEARHRKFSQGINLTFEFDASPIFVPIVIFVRARCFVMSGEKSHSVTGSGLAFRSPDL
jgi:hypothetical protein